MLRKAFACGAALGALMLASNSSFAQVNLIQNGDFEVTTGHSSGEWDTNNPYVNVTGWISNGYNFVFAPDTADTTGAHSSEFNNELKLWGPGNGVNNGLTNSPTGGNFVAADGAFQQGAITQVINGLTVGHSYQLGFYWAGAQQQGFDGPNTEQWQATLGSDTQLTSVYTNPSHGFSGWQQESFTYTATSTSETLAFLALGTPNGVPPFSLLDGVTLYDISTPPPTDTPEPGAMALAAAGLAGFAGAALRRRRLAAK